MEQTLPFELPDSEAVYCLGRALVLAILVSSEALLARQKRVGFERHLILFSAFLFLGLAELMGALLGLTGMDSPQWMRVGAWVWYPALSSVALLGVAFCFDFVRVTRTLPAGGRTKGVMRSLSRRFVIASAVVLALGALLTVAPFAGRGAPTSYREMGNASVLLHGVQALAMAALGMSVYRARGIWLSAIEGRIFMFACLSGALGALMQVVTGPREHLTTMAYSIFVAVILRDNYRRSEIETVRASEERTSRTLLFHRITTQLKSTSDLPILYAMLMDSLLGNLGAESGAIYVLDDRDKKLHAALTQGPYPPPARRDETLTPVEGNPPHGYPPVAPGEGVIGAVVQTGIPLYLYDAAGVARHYTWPGAAVRTTIALPLRSPDGIYGAVQVVNRLDGAPFAEEDLRFMSLIVEQAGLAIHNARLHEEILQRQKSEEQLKVARQIQLGLIPSQLPQIPGLSLGVQYHAAQEVGGDYFDFYRIDHDHLGVVVFDVAGKGVPGALLMAITATFLKMAAPRSISPAWVLNEVNAALSAEMRRGMFVTASYAVLTLSTLQLTFVNAGHPDTLIIRERDLNCEFHKPRGAALGMLRPNRFRAVMEQETLQLEQGDTVLFYTDGVIEALDTKGETFGAERLITVCRRFAREGPRQLAAEIVEAVRRHAGDAPQYDDITVVALRVWPEPEPAHPPTGETP